MNLETELSEIIPNKELILMERPLFYASPRDLIRILGSAETLAKDAQRKESGIAKMILSVTSLDMFRKYETELGNRQ